MMIPLHYEQDKDREEAYLKEIKKGRDKAYLKDIDDKCIRYLEGERDDQKRVPKHRKDEKSVYGTYSVRYDAVCGKKDNF